MSKINGNMFKGNNQQKGRRRKKEVNAEFDPETDSYGKIVSGLGNCKMGVQLLNEPSTAEKPVHASIRGIHKNKVYYKKGDLVVIRHNANIYEIWGMVSDHESRKIRDEFDRSDGKGDSSIITFGSNDDHDEEPTSESLNIDDI